MDNKEIAYYINQMESHFIKAQECFRIAEQEMIQAVNQSIILKEKLKENECL